jgi:phosphate transport system permease protein
LVLVYADGTAQRYDARDIQAPVLAETVALVGESGAELSALEFLLGRQTILVGDSNGGVGAWFMIREEVNPSTPDGWTLVKGHELEGGMASVTFLASSRRTRTAIAGYADGSIRAFNVTTEKLLAEPRIVSGTPVDAVALAPKEDAIFAIGGGQITHWDVDIKHPEGALSALFLPVWYEGMPEPQHIWQSSSGDDAFEPKLGLVPLIFGTFKATLYAMLFGLPVALLAAVYTSEFLNPRLKAVLKPTIELMASLPSVVLGFIAALVLAPLVENVVPSILTALLLVPVSLLLGAQCWQLLPQRTARNLAPYRLAFILLALVLGVWGSTLLGPVVERTAFSGDFRHYLTGQVGTGIPAWLLLLIPISAVCVVLVNSIWVGPLLRAKTFFSTRTSVVTIDFARSVVSMLAVLLLAYGVAAVLNAFGFDPRGGASYVGTYVQRNAMVVGFVMAFAIIPIIYTIAEDALSTVPEHLRAASLGAGATHWQTAVRIVLPAAMSGLFSAMMIGLGRAVGETMIVLMAAGNTPVMEWNIFSGLRTLAANIAVELPEAPKDGTHYRTLFMAALVLFIMTFAVNTVAELVRLRFRKKASSL